MKEGYVEKSAAGADMAKINRYTRREFKPEEVYTFSLVLCDNEADRDYERFSIPSLTKLQELFLGKTCILDHERKSQNQTARIYDTAVEEAPGRVTQAGEVYTRLTAKAYLPRTEKNSEVIELIESGILKEVSVSCAVKRSVCGICGRESCSHQKGKEYGGKVCVRVLEDPTDAYECSFVAVPAQREAGVKKSWQLDGAWEKKLSAPSGDGVRLTLSEARSLQKELRDLRERASWGDGYREKMKSQVLKYSGLLQPQVPGEVMKGVVEKLSLSELSHLGKAYRQMAEKAFPLKVQLAPDRGKPQEEEDGAYRI